MPAGSGPPAGGSRRSATGGWPSTPPYASLESAVALLRCAMAPLGVDGMMSDPLRALELEPPGSPWYPLACMSLGTAHVLRGGDEAALRAFERTAYFGNDRQSSAVITAHAQLSLLAAGRGDWAAAATA